VVSSQERKCTKVYCRVIEGAIHSTFSDTLQQPRQLRQQISGMQQQGLVASQWCKNLARRYFREGTGIDIRKYMIRSQLSNISDCHVKLLLAQARIDAQAPFFSCQISGLSLHFHNKLIICMAYFSVYECLIIGGVRVSIAYSNQFRGGRGR